MVCSICGISKHNKITCDKVLIDNKIDTSIVISTIRDMFCKVDDAIGRKKKVDECRNLFNYLLFHKWILIKNKKLHLAAILKCKEFSRIAKKDFTNIDEYIDKFSKLWIIKTFETDECPICFDKLNKTNILTTICGHSFCETCITRHIKYNLKCPMCRTKIL